MLISLVTCALSLFTHTHIHIHTYTHTHIHTCTHTHTHIHTCILDPLIRTGSRELPVDVELIPASKSQPIYEDNVNMRDR